jgi:uncharacterized protein
VVELQRPFAGKKTITNALQTNGTLLDDEWCHFLKQHHFMVGISLDGPREIHYRYRRDRQGMGTFDAVMRGLKLLQKYGVEYNVMASAARETARQPQEVYRFFKGEGVEFIQFVPVIERLAAPAEQQLGLKLAAPALLDHSEPNATLTPWTVPGYATHITTSRSATTWKNLRRRTRRRSMPDRQSRPFHHTKCGSLVISPAAILFACDHALP